MKTHGVIVGGGVIGLSLANELARMGWQVTLFDKGNGKEASWAGAGILPPANLQTAVHPWDQLRALSHQLYPEWASRLRSETGIDNGYHVCGGLYLGRSQGEKRQRWQPGNQSCGSRQLRLKN